jgi:HEAT repeat protein
VLFGLSACGGGCQRDERGPTLAGGHEVSHWVTALRDPNPKVRREAVLKLGNVGDADPSVPEALAQALEDSDSQVRYDAVRAVVKLSKPGAAIKAKLETMSQNDKDARIRDVSTKALASPGKFD